MLHMSIWSACIHGHRSIAPPPRARETRRRHAWRMVTYISTCKGAARGEWPHPAPSSDRPLASYTYIGARARGMQGAPSRIRVRVHTYTRGITDLVHERRTRGPAIYSSTSSATRPYAWDFRRGGPSIDLENMPMSQRALLFSDVEALVN